MGDSKMLQQIKAILRFFMALFYLGAAIFMLFFSAGLQIDRALLIIVGSAFLFYGTYRTYVAVVRIYKLFFTKETEED